MTDGIFTRYQYLHLHHPKEARSRLGAISNAVAGSVGISTITLAELQHGVAKSIYIEENQQALHEFLVPIDILDFDYEAAMLYGEIRAYLEKTGQTIGLLDMLIAAHAKSLDVTVVTNNEKEFRRVPGLKVENWMV